MEKINQNELVEKPIASDKDEALNKENDNDVVVSEKDAQILVPLNSDVMQEAGKSSLDRAYPLNFRSPRDEQCQALALVDTLEKSDMA